MNIEPYDRMVQLTVNSKEVQQVPVEINNVHYILKQELESDDIILRLVDEQNAELIKVHTKEVFAEILEDEESYGEAPKCCL